MLPVDLAIPGSADELGRRAQDALGTVDIAINNAGTNLTGAQSLVADSAAARAVFEVNVWSPLALTSALLPAMRAADSGVIVNVTSTVQAVPLPPARLLLRIQSCSGPGDEVAAAGAGRDRHPGVGGRTRCDRHSAARHR
ncbi:hypothetical protein ATO49_17980 [Mycolicibacterium fortuitum subsp. fortuitum DSM 46621 = ATCC 6841 = JCM 6387]|nr:hypothetical protein ATO49_17980 [Mycolicibacterium fortuitum subsp. fortuitum DSM 46621 = ATCC 6841 = JCM 6387]